MLSLVRPVRRATSLSVYLPSNSNSQVCQAFGAASLRPPRFLERASICRTPNRRCNSRLDFAAAYCRAALAKDLEMELFAGTVRRSERLAAFKQFHPEKL